MLILRQRAYAAILRSMGLIEKLYKRCYVHLGMIMNNLVASLFGRRALGASSVDRKELRQLQARADEIHMQLVAEGKVPDNQEDAQSWVAARENGYVNCLLTVLAEGTTDSAVITQDERLPDLNALASGTPDLALWVSTLAFPYGELSASVVLGILARSFELKSSPRGRLKTILVKNDGAPLAAIFYAEFLGQGIKLSVVRAN